MRDHTMKALALVAGFVLCGADACKTEASGYDLDVLVDGSPRPEYDARGKTYVEALRGTEYSLRLTNPTGNRVAVALSVDGLNTIDAKRSDPRKAAKWVLEPYESIEIDGWQVSESAARRFYFTGENDSYGAMLGQTRNLGVIEAVFFEERLPKHSTYRPRWNAPREESAAEGRDQAPPAPRSSAAPMQGEKLSDDYAATGMGDRQTHEVERIDIDLERRPAASIRIRYEFRPQLVRLGIFDDENDYRPLDRRERARGFGAYCPEPN